MGNRVMDMKQIQTVPVSHLHHSGSQSEGIRRVLEKRIVRDLDFVVENSRGLRIQPDGMCIADEMNIVAAVRQFQTQFRRDNAAASVGRIACDADTHGLSMSGRRPAISGRQDDFPDVLAAFHALMSTYCFVQRKNGINDWPDWLLSG